jgi:hypothetical protein
MTTYLVKTEDGDEALLTTDNPYLLGCKMWVSIGCGPTRGTVTSTYTPIEVINTMGVAWAVRLVAEALQSSDVDRDATWEYWTCLDLLRSTEFKVQEIANKKI